MPRRPTPSPRRPTRAALRAARKALQLTPDQATSRAREALDLLARPGVRARVERRLLPGAIENLTHDLASLRTDTGAVTAAHNTQLGATGEVATVADEAAAWYAALRRTADRRHASPATRKALGIGAVHKPTATDKFTTDFTNAVTAVRDEATRAALGLLPEDVAAGEDLVARLAEASGVAVGTRTARKRKVRDRRDVQKSLEDALSELATAGQQEYWRPTEADTREAFIALTRDPPKHPRKPPPTPTGMPTG